MAGPNAAGCVPVIDAAVPRIISCVASTEISGGQLVVISGASNCVSSGMNSFKTTDLAVNDSASGAQFNGVALKNVESGSLVGVALRGAFILPASAAVTIGTHVAAKGDSTVGDATSGEHHIGRAITPAASGGYSVVDIHG